MKYLTAEDIQNVFDKYGYTPKADIEGYEIQFDPEGQEHHNFVRVNMMYEKNPSWSPFGDEGEGDTIGRSMRAGRIYKRKSFFRAVRSCWERKIRRGGKVFLFGWRSNKNRDRMDMSRDHLVNTILMEYWDLGSLGVWLFYPFVPWRFSFGFKQTIDIRLWAYALMKKKWARHAYYWWQIPQSLVVGVWSKFWKLILGVEKELTQDEFVANRDMLAYKRHCLGKWLSLIPPVYAMLGRAEQLECMPRSPGRWILRKILLWNTPRHNLVMKILLGKKVTRLEVLAYRTMYGGRWSTSLDCRCKRDVGFRKLGASKANRMDKDWLVFLFDSYC